MRESSSGSLRSHPLRRLLQRLGPAILAAFVLAACSGDGCGSGCASEGFEQRPFPDQHADKTIPQAGQIRVTDTGLTFLESEVGNIITQVLPNGLNFCLPQTSASGADVCVDSTCNSGQNGCQFQFNLQNTSLTPDPQQTINVAVTIGGVDEDIPFNALGGECVAHLHEPGQNSDVATSIDVEVPISFIVQDQTATNDVEIELGTVQADISESALAIDIDPRTGDWGDEIVCGGADIGFIKGLIRGELESRFKDRINSAVQQAVDQQLCKRCGGMQTSCPSGSSCGPLDPDADQPIQVCNWDDGEGCVGRALGLEGRLSLGELIGGPHEPQTSQLEAMLTAADHAEVVDGGLELGMRAGAVPTPTHRCVPDTKSTRPSFDEVPLTPAILSNTKPNSSESFMVGLGLHERAVNYALWSLWASGGTCLRIGSDFNSLLNTSSLGLLLPAIKDLPTDTSPLFLRLSPQTPPSVTLGSNNITTMNDMRSLEDPLITLNWTDVDIHFYAYAQNRFARMFSLRVDIELPVGLATDGPSTVVPVLGDIESAAKNIRVRNARILDTSKEDIRGLLPTLLSAVGSELTSTLVQPFELPSFYGYRVALDQDDITSVDNESFIALYADFMRTTTLRAMPQPQAPQVRLSEVTVRRDGEIPRPTVDVELATPRRLFKRGETTYLWRLNDGGWHEFDPESDNPVLTIDSPMLALQGEHTLEVKARRRGDIDSSWSPSTVTTIPIDLGPPSIEVSTRRLDDDRLLFDMDIDDAVAEPEGLRVRMRWRQSDESLAGVPEHGSWTVWRNVGSLPAEGVDASTLPGWSTVNTAGARLELEVQAVDPEGHRSTATTAFKLTDSTVNSDNEPRAGCRTAPNQTPGFPLGTFALFTAALVGLVWSRMRDLRSALKGLAATGALVLAAFTLAGCPGSSTQGPCDGNCGAWETCEGGVCTPTPCSSAEECPDGARCRDGQCWPCANECGNAEYCCHNTGSCKSLPNPCSNKSCQPGYEPTVAESPQVDASSCSASGGSCECTEKAPLELTWYGRHVSADTGGGVRAVAAYNREFGDLQIGVLNDSLQPTWYVPDGVPSEGSVVAAPSGPRGGLEDEGEDVGTHAGLAIDSSGRIHVFYRHKETGALTYARAEQTDSGLETKVLDGIDDAGTDNAMFNAAAVRDGTVHALYSVRRIENTDGEFRSQIRSVSFPVDASFDQLAPEPSVVFDSQSHNPCGTSCSGDEVCFAASGTCAQPDASCGGSADAGMSGASCSGDGEACRNGECESVYQRPENPAYPLMTGLHTELKVTPAGSLLAVFYDNIRERVGWMSRPADGQWSSAQFLDVPSGPYADATVDEQGRLHLAYMSPRSRALRYRRTSGSDTIQPETDEMIRPSIRSGDERLTARIGHNVRLWLDEGTPEVVFHDPTKHTLLSGSRNPDGTWATETLAAPERAGSYTGARGFYATAVPSTGGGSISGFAVEQVINQQSDPPGAELEFHALP